MSIRTFTSYDEMSTVAAELVFETIVEGLNKNGSAVIGLPTGSSPIGMYEALLELFAQNLELDLSGLHFFNLDEYWPMEQADSQSYYAYMMNYLWTPLATINNTFRVEVNAHIVNGEAKDAAAESQRYEEELARFGGIDMMVIGVGTNGHVGFNEPGSSVNSRTRLVDLAEETRVSNTRFYGELEAVPQQAITMGMGTIMESKRLLLLIAGNGKDRMLEVLKEGTVKDDIPVSFLLEHPGFEIYSCI